MEGIQELRSHTPFEEVWDRLVTDLEKKGVPVFSVIDHKKNALSAGLTMPETRVIIFGNPAVGTHLMLSAPGIALDLPLKIAVREDNGTTVVSWMDMRQLANRYGLSLENEAVTKVSAFMAAVIQGLPA